MKRFITIAVKEPNEKWQMCVVEDALPVYQKIVGGYIEHVYTMDEGILVFGNEEGMIKRLPTNILGEQVFFGTLFAVRSDEEGEFQCLTDKDFISLGIRGASNEK